MSSLLDNLTSFIAKNKDTSFSTCLVVSQAISEIKRLKKQEADRSALEAQVKEEVHFAANEMLDLCVAADAEVASLKAKLAGAHAVLKSFKVKAPDGDGDVWLVLGGHGAVKGGAVNLGSPDRIVASVAAQIEVKRTIALAA
jgi:hypothetical protein